MGLKVSITAALLVASAANAQTPKTEDEKTIYALGLAFGRGLKDFNLTKAELELVKKGLSDQVHGKPQVELDQFGPKFETLRKSRMEAVSKVFLDKAAKEKGAQVLPSGLIFTELKAGAGESPKATDTVKVHYRGTLTTGEEFDSSYKRNEPTQFPLNGVIPCWTEGVQKIKPGGKAKLVCPSKIAYGDMGRPPQIPGGATLVFEVELIEIVKNAPAPGAMPAPKK